MEGADFVGLRYREYGNKGLRVFTALIALTILLSLKAFTAFYDIRKPAVAGMFYPGTKTELSKKVNQFLNNVKDQKLKGKLIALIIPHAGYDYSGQVAAYAYKELEGRHFKLSLIHI